MPQTSEKLRRLAEVEWLRAEVETRRLARRLLWTIIATCIGILALAVLAYAGFLILASQIGTIEAALVTGSALALIAAISTLLALRGPSRTQELENEILARSIADAREDLRLEIEALEAQIKAVTSGISPLLGRKQAEAENAQSQLQGNLAAIVMILKALAAMSPALDRYIRPVLKIID